MNNDTIEHEALKLPTSARAALAQKLLESLDEPSDDEAAQFWLDQAEHRAVEIDNGSVQWAASDEVSRRAWALLR